LEIFFVNEKVCLEKQNSQYSRSANFHHFHDQQASIAALTTIAVFVK